MQVACANGKRYQQTFSIKRVVEQLKSCNAGGTADFGAPLEIATRLAQTGSNTLGCSWGDPECSWVLCGAPGSSWGFICNQNWDRICLPHSIREVRRPSTFQSKFGGEDSSLLPPPPWAPCRQMRAFTFVFARAQTPKQTRARARNRSLFGVGARAPKTY